MCCRHGPRRPCLLAPLPPRPARQLPAGVHRLRPEEPEGNVEYKLKLRVDHAGARFQHLVTQMKFRLTAGQGEAFYVVGVEDDGWPQGLDARELQASVVEGVPPPMRGRNEIEITENSL